MSAGLLVSGFILNLLSFLLNFACYAAPFWVKEGGAAAYTYSGLWGKCSADVQHCEWFWAQGFTEMKQRPAWFQASTALYGCAIVFHFQALLTAMLHLCFCRKRSQITNVISGFLIITFIMVGIPVIIYGVEQHKPGNNYGFSTDGKMFYVAFYVAIVNAGITLVASMIYSCHSCRNP